MAHTKEYVTIIVKESINEIVESLAAKIYSKICQPTDANNTQKLVLDTNLLPEKDKQKLVNYTDDKGIINIVHLVDNECINLVLEISAYNGHLEVVKFLVEKGASVNNALYISACNGHLEVVKFLVEKGASVNNALTNSAGNGHLEIVKFLIEKGASINNTYALYNSVCNGHLEVVKFFVSKCVVAKIPIPDNCINKEYNDINKFLFMHVNKDKHRLFNDKLVLKLAPIKNLLK